MRPGSAKIVLLGAQRPVPTLRDAVDALGLVGPYALASAGWQEYEEDDDEIEEALQARVINLRLHHRGELVFSSDGDFHAAYRARQERLRQYQDLYRVRLDHAQQAAAGVLRRRVDPELVEAEEESCIQMIRLLDAQHLGRCREQHANFDCKWKPTERQVVERHRTELASMIGDARALLIAGGHVAVLLNRLKLFDIAGLIEDRTVIAWSAGAMAISERVVLYHDNPPQGRPIAEVLDAGLGLCPDVVPLTNPERRLNMTDPERVANYARRFAPALCLALGKGARVTHDGTHWTDAHSVHVLRADGGAPELAGEEGADAQATPVG